MDRTLLLKFKNYVKNNESYLGKFKTTNGNILLVQKWPYLKTFDITYLDNNMKHIKNIYSNLYPFDCFNMIEELIHN